MEDIFEKLIQDAKIPEPCYLVLYEDCPYYGGPEEGGWWGTDQIVRFYKSFLNPELAEAAKQLIEAEAKRLTEEARRKEGKYCLSQMEFLEDRGLEADYLRENDGPSRFYVEVINTIPENHYGARHYE